MATQREEQAPAHPQQAISELAGLAPDGEMLACTAAAARKAKRAGDFAPTFRLPDLHGGSTALIDLIATGPLVISFYRGIWCSFCETELDQLSRIAGEIRSLGARLIAIGPSPASPDQQQRLASHAMPVLIDRDLKVAASYGLTVNLPNALRAHYVKSGYVPPSLAGAGGWQVPIPATYVIGQNGRIVLTSIDADYRQRLAPDQLLLVLRHLRHQHVS